MTVILRYITINVNVKAGNTAPAHNPLFLFLFFYSCVKDHLDSNYIFKSLFQRVKNIKVFFAPSATNASLISNWNALN